ncbi:hypothetical protein DAPPUDRAFT_118892 [Daphnia pulex]|uniref:Uncharacterized protein n=1 Tax=Daphnia pulex TaxID=6669 RepID=E9HWZ1_DAPPU|nr:hypothetical protein DAPPUDRAFT_118892 [Daphnia pulex]|eukprot:EFX63742.1 hypothetical protein DAPPUDRAFT_118892 [Daphnia pulex]
MSSRPQTSGSQQNSPRVPSFLLARQQHRSSPSSPSNILDRLIPCRSEMNMLLAQHLLSPMSHHYDSEQQDSPRQSMPILKFSNKVVKVKPMTPKSKFKIPTSPHRVMAAPGTFLYFGNQSTHWAPSDNFVVALVDGVYVYNETYKKTEVCINDARDPFCHVIWNSTGDSIICGSGGGEIQIYDLNNTPDPKIKWRLLKESGTCSMALGQHHLLTCAAWSVSFEGVGVYDLRQTGGSTEPILSLHQNLAAFSLSWSTNGHLLAVGGESATYLWDVRHPSKAMNIFRNSEDENPGDENSVTTVMNWCPWNPNVLFTGTSYPELSIRLHNATTGELIDAFECASEVSGIQFNVELEQVATSHKDFSREDATRHVGIHGEVGTVQFWEFNTSNNLNPIQKISYHKEGIISMAASANSSQLLTLGGDEKLCLWNWKNKTAPHSNKNSEAGFQTTRSQLDAFNLIR